MHAEDARSGERREPLDYNSTIAKVSIEKIELGGSNKFNNGVRHLQLEVCEDDQSKIALLGRCHV